MSHITKLIDTAQQLLREQPFDIAHDFEHHQLVVANCRAIIESEKLHPDEDVIMVAAWWHDINKSYATSNSADSTIAFFQKTAQELGATPEFIDQVMSTIAEHSFNQTQTHLHSYILFDADKIEYVNAQRIQKLLDDVEARPSAYGPTFLADTHQIWTDRLKVVKDKMHYNYSKALFTHKLGATDASLARLKALL